MYAIAGANSIAGANNYSSPGLETTKKRQSTAVSVSDLVRRSLRVKGMWMAFGSVSHPDFMRSAKMS